MDFSEKLKLVLRENGLTQREFSEKVGMEPAHANKFFTGRKPNYEFLLKVVKAFPKIDLNWLLLDQDEHNTNWAVTDGSIPITKKEAEIYIRNIEQNLSELKQLLTQN